MATRVLYTRKPTPGPRGSIFQIGAHFNLDGLHRIVAGLQSAEVVAIATEELEPVVSMAKSLVHVKTGALQRSIRIELKEFSNNRVVVTITAGDEVIFYAPYQEFGTSKHPPYPYLTPAWEALGATVKAQIKARIALLVQRLANR